MIDIKFLRENPDVVKQNIKNKFQDSKLPLVDEVIDRSMALQCLTEISSISASWYCVRLFERRICTIL